MEFVNYFNGIFIYLHMYYLQYIIFIYATICNIQVTATCRFIIINWNQMLLTGTVSKGSFL